MDTLINFVKESQVEFQKVNWPDKEATIRLTVYVIAVSLIIGVFVAGADYLFTETLALIF